MDYVHVSSSRICQSLLQAEYMHFVAQISDRNLAYYHHIL